MNRRKTKRAFSAFGAAIVAATLAVTGANSAASAPEADQVYQVEGLQGPAEILVDEHGVPHIYAGEHYDSFFAQGFNAARDRLWQIDTWRRRGLGQLSEVFGPAYVEQDRANRMFSFRGDMSREWLAYGNDAKQIAEAYTAGINAYIKLAKENDELMPWEFKFLGYEPDLWAPEDTVRPRTHALVGNVENEVERAYFVRDFGLQYEDIRDPLDAGWQTKVPDGLDLDLLPEDPDELLEVYDLATSGVDFDDVNLEQFGAATVNGQPVTPASDAASDRTRAQEDDTDEELDPGSNTFAVSPERTAVDGALIASDPHRGQSVPSLRYMAHLNAPGIDVIGAGEPGLPGVSLGHNQDIAFGLTIYDIDQEDLYVYRTRNRGPNRPTEYRYQGRWVPMNVETEQVAVSGGEPASVEMKFTQHGPVIYEDPKRRVAFAVRTVWSGPGTGAYFGSVEYMRAENWREFLGAMNRWGTPGENQQYADAAGNIGWKPGGRTPIRPNWDGVLPVPGDGTYEWDGFYDMDQLPVSFNPERGWLQTNNESRLFDDHETGPLPEYVNRKIGFEASAPWRALRTREVLAEMDNATLESMFALQTDHLSIPGRRITAELDDVTSDDPDVAQALDMLRNWDHVMHLDSAAAALFDVWTDIHGAPGVGDGFLGQALLPHAVDDPAAVERIDEPAQTTLVDMVENPENWFDGDAEAVRNSAITSSLASAMQKLTEDQGPDPAGWRFGFYNQLDLNHELSELVDAETRAAIDIEAREKEPVGNTVGASGASWRYVAEPGNWDTAIAMSNPGQSGDPDSPFYENLFIPWANGETFPLLYSREAIEQNTALSIRLEPAG